MSSGERIPIVFYPRYSVLTASPTGGSNSTTYYTTPRDMLGFSAFSVTAFRSTITGGAIAIATDWTFEESSDLLGRQFPDVTAWASRDESDPLRWL